MNHKIENLENLLLHHEKCLRILEKKAERYPANRQLAHVIIKRRQMIKETNDLINKTVQKQLFNSAQGQLLRISLQQMGR